MTDVERTLWSTLRNRGLGGLKFRRQATIGPYVVDFLCIGAMLVIELDGGQHDLGRDRARTLFIEARGYIVVRVWNGEVTSNLAGVLETILAVARRRRPSPNPLPRAGEG